MTAFSLPRIVSSLQARGLLVSTSENLPDSINSISDDTRSLTAGDLFVAVRGLSHDGHVFLHRAAELGAAAAIVETPGPRALPNIVVRDSRLAAAVAAATFQRFPSREMRVVGVTGTNGKTTTVNLLRHILDRPGAHAASIGTLGATVGSVGQEHDIDDVSALTTPGAIELQRLLRRLADNGVKSVAMEASSHSLDQRRVDAIDFAVAIFTNVSRDHIDYHQTMEAYFKAKARLGELLARDGVAVVNADEAIWDSLSLSGRRTVHFAASGSTAEVHAVDVKYHQRGSSWTLVIDGERRKVDLPLIGAFNVSNALGAAAAAWSLGMAPATVAARLSSVPQVPGRMEVLLESPLVLRDYSHTPDALQRALAALRPFAPDGIAVVFGCGGDRDRGKRPLMGAIAERLADHVIITSDNPRTEDPELILDDIEKGMQDRRHERIEDRRAAIARALDVGSSTGKAVLLAGKGHETYQIRGQEKLHFDEKEIVRELAGRAE